MDYGMLWLGIVILVGAAMLGSAAVERKLGRVNRRLARMERKLDTVLDHLGIATSDPEFEHVKVSQGEGVAARRR